MPIVLKDCGISGNLRNILPLRILDYDCLYNFEFYDNLYSVF